MRTPPIPLAAFAILASLAACGDRGRPETPAAGVVRVLATVNGVPITENDVDPRSRAAGLEVAPGHDVPANVLQTVVRDELIRQKAVALGLDRDPAYRARLDALQAQVRAFQRRELASLYRGYVQDQAAVTDAEAQAFFDANAALIRTRFHVLQILHRGGDAEIAKERDDVRSGTPFEQVAARRFPGLPPGARAPWDLGELSWFQLPPSWRGVVDRLEPGQVSDPIRGDGDRVWLVKLAGKEVDPRITFAAEKERIVQVLRHEKAATLYDRMLAELKAKATVAYPSP